MPETRPATQLLRRLSEGDGDAAQELFTVVYEELRNAAQHVLGRGGRAVTLQPTALVHEAYLRLVDQDASDFEGRTHFLRTAVRAMRQVVIDRARARGAEKRGGGRDRIPLDLVVDRIEDGAVDAIALDEALTRLAEMDERLARVVELRFFGGLTMEETARVISVSVPTVERDWRFARTWLQGQLKGEAE